MYIVSIFHCLFVIKLFNMLYFLSYICLCLCRPCVQCGSYIISSPGHARMHRQIRNGKCLGSRSCHLLGASCSLTDEFRVVQQFRPAVCHAGVLRSKPGSELKLRPAQQPYSILVFNKRRTIFALAARHRRTKNDAVFI